MKLVTVVAGALVGGALATMICWGALYVYGAFVLRGEGSLFDTNPEIANLFFVGWSVLTAIGAAIAAIIVTRMRS
ncbi:hypothetical protein [Burkholderia sp. IDO3]|uniref:hypothetical protein n=1 Tax=Burkholderia sp. IDO3 TaxID=1705310 RepID=UPI000BBB5F14|nr:hypothetical protein [Burkholderia sp. IDO3]AXK61218.1 hypothetical protein DCN14_00055 [Burkholderia sp. IDO3]PCD57120.1 hypothetical protein CN645_35745 [Burkholderia sp. IDO3]